MTAALPPGRLRGREPEIARILHLLEVDRVPVVTVTGRGGVGKTALASEVGGRLASHGVEVVEVWLAGVTDPDLVLDEVARSLGLPPAPGELSSVIARHVRGRRMVILLDNLEHLLPAASSLVSLLDRAPGLQLLVTSQAPLRLRREQLVRLGPLEVPPPGERDVERIANHPSVSMYCDRAAAVNQGFGLDPETAPAVAELCRRLEGLPLAIELAAARSATLPATEILARIHTRPLDLLHREQPDAPPRHRDLRGAIEWTAALLAPAERTLLQRLSVVAGAFSVETAESLADDTASAVDALSALVDLHLVDPGPWPGWFVLPAAVRAFAADELAAGGSLDAVTRRHVQARVAWTRLVRSSGEWRDDGEWIALAARCHDDLLHALAQAVELGLVDDALGLVESLAPWWEATGYRPAHQRLVTAAVERAHAAGADRALLARAMAASAVLKVMQRFGSDVSQHLGELEEAEQVARTAGDPEALLHVLSGWMITAPYTLDWSQAVRAGAEGLAVAEAEGLAGWRGPFEVWNGMLAHGAGDDDRAVALGLRGLATGRETRDRRTIVIATMLLRPLAWKYPWLEERVPSTAEALRLALEAGETVLANALVAAVAGDALRAGDLDAAGGHLLDGLRLGRLGQAGVTEVMLFAAAMLFSAWGDHRRVAWIDAVLASSQTLLKQTVPPESVPPYERAVERAHHHLGETAVAEVRLEVTGLTMLDAVAVVEEATRKGLAVRPDPPGLDDTAPPADGTRLTPRQREVLRWLATGLSNREIAGRLGLTPKTVAHHLAAIYAQLGVRGRSEATAWAHRNGLAG